MNVNEITSNTNAVWKQSGQAQKQDNSESFAAQVENAVGGQQRTHKVYLKTDDMLYSGGNGSGLSFYIKYAEESTEENPVVVAKGVDENGKEFEQTIAIREINPRCATLVEMHALEAYLGVEKQGRLSSLPHSSDTGQMGLYDRGNFMDMFQKNIRDMDRLGASKSASYYRDSMQAYWDFMKKKVKGIPQEEEDCCIQDDAASDTKKVSESKSDSKIITNPDGSRTLLVTMHVGSLEMVTSMEISKALPAIPAMLQEIHQNPV
ncbi:MAG: hypothetical protein NC419_06605 [Muribaculaceae bacterium]|nr:hypothetical protein [Muribaculaceae bacterium]